MAGPFEDRMKGVIGGWLFLTSTQMSRKDAQWVRIH
jgi:hypothetical protein